MGWWLGGGGAGGGWGRDKECECPGVKQSNTDADEMG